MKNTNIVAIIFLLFISFQLHGQKSSLRIGFGMSENVHFGFTHVIDSILISPHPGADGFRPMFIVSYNKRIKDRLEMEFGIGFSKIYHSYIAGLYNPTFGYTKKVGGNTVSTFTFPININVRLLKGFYAKAGLSAALGISSKSEDTYFNDTPGVNDVYNSMPDIFKPHSFGYGFGCGYKIGRFDFVFYRRTSITKMTYPLNVNGEEYDMYGDFHTNSLFVTYSIFFKEKLEEKNDL